jgi:hypothetical protein
MQIVTIAILALSVTISAQDVFNTSSGSAHRFDAQSRHFQVALRRFVVAPGSLLVRDFVANEVRLDIGKRFLPAVGHFHLNRCTTFAPDFLPFEASTNVPGFSFPRRR